MKWLQLGRGKKTESQTAKEDTKTVLGEQRLRRRKRPRYGLKKRIREHGIEGRVLQVKKRWVGTQLREGGRREGSTERVGGRDTQHKE